jgi:hypothetical protein
MHRNDVDHVEGALGDWRQLIANGDIFPKTRITAATLFGCVNGVDRRYVFFGISLSFNIGVATRFFRATAFGT